MKKFVVVCSYLPSIINFREKLLDIIKLKGFEVHILYPDNNDENFDKLYLQNKGFILHSIPMGRTRMNPLEDLKTFFYFYLAFKKLSPDYVLSYTIKPVIYGTLAAWFAKVPNRFCLITGLGYAFTDSGESRYSFLMKLIRNLYGVAVNKSNKVFFQNPDDKNLFLQLGLLNSKVPSVIINGSGVDLEKFCKVHLPKDNDGKVLFSFLLVGRLLKDKGILEYIEVAKKIKEKYPNVQFHLVGKLDENPTSIKQCDLDEWIRNEVIQYWGYLSDVRPAIERASVYILPSYREGTPRSVLEAMAMGRAIITTDAPGCRETVVDGYNGYLVDVASVDSLYKAVEKLIHNPDLLQTMGDCSYEIAVNKYDVNKVNAHILTEIGL